MEGNNYWHLIYNKLKILVDPQYFADRNMIEIQVNLVTMLHDYLDGTEPSLCDVQFNYPKYIEEKLNIRRVFNSLDTKIVYVEKPKEIISFFSEEIFPDENVRQANNELLSLAIENKIPFILSNLEIARKEEVELIKRFNITFIKHPLLQKKIEAFIQGFYNYYKFNLVQGIDGPDMAHAMSDPLHRELYLFENRVKLSGLSDIQKERVRSFVHNRYIDILVTVDKITFYKIQQQISDIERGILDNKSNQFHGSIRYYLNYYLLLLWGYIDHMCLIINDVFVFGYNEETSNGRRKIGFMNYDGKKEYLEKLKVTDSDLYYFVVSKDFQEWLDVLGQLRHKNAHREMISPSPLLQTTPASEISDEEIDAIIYKDRKPMDERVMEMMPSLVEPQKQIDRAHYKISKMNKLFDHIALVRGGILDPIARIDIDMENIKKLTDLFLKASEKADTLITKK